MHNAYKSSLMTSQMLTTQNMLLARPTLSCFGFTRAYKKIVLTKDVGELGFAGEICFVKPGHAFNELVPSRQALFFTDPKASQFLKKVNVSVTSPLFVNFNCFDCRF